MKNKYSILSLVGILLLAAVSCKEDEKFATKSLAPGDIRVSVPEAALSSSGGQPQVTQPDLNIVAGRFASTDDVTLTIGLNNGLSNLTIQTLAGSGATTVKGTFNGISGSMDWTYPVNTLGIGGAAVAAGSSAVLQLVASSADGAQVTSKVFSINVVDPFTLTATNATTAFADSAATQAFSVPASTTLFGITKVDYYTKRGRLGTETLAATKTYANSKSLSDNFPFKMPADNVSGGAVLDTMYLRFVATYAPGRTVTKNTTVRFLNVPLTRTSGTITLYNPAVTGTNTASTSYDFGKLAMNTAAAAETIKDLKLTVTGLDIGITVGAGNTTRFVKTTTAALFTSPTFQQLQTAFLAGAPVTSATNVFIGDMYIVEIDGNTGKPASARYGIFRVSAVVQTPGTDNNDTVSLEFKAK